MPSPSIAPNIETEYPESDGQPMGETDLHIEWIIRLRDMLKWRYRDRQVYVGANLLLYYEEGTPWKFVVPDIFVVHECPPDQRRVFKLWEEGLAPNVVIEVTSRSSRREDAMLKPKTYEDIGVHEYFLYDPSSEYLNPALQGHRLEKDGYSRISPEANSSLRSKELDLELRLENGQLVLTDHTTGSPLLMRWEAEQLARETERQAHEAERTSRAAAEAEVERLRRLLDERSSE